MNKKKLIMYAGLTLLCIFSISNVAHSKKKDLEYPINCKVMGFKFDHYHVVFSQREQHQQTIYFIKNISGEKVYLLSTGFPGRPYTVYIDGSVKPKLWSVLALGEKANFICTHYSRSSKKHSVIDCSKVLKICEFPRSRFGPNSIGNYWLAKDKSMRGSVSAARWHGILLTDPRKPEVYPVSNDATTSIKE